MRNFWLYLSRQEGIAYSALQAFLSVAVFLFELYECLRVACRLNVESALLPHGDDMISFGFELFEKVEGAVAERFVSVVSPVGEEHGDGGVDKEQRLRRCRQFLLAERAFRAKRIVVFPILCGFSGQ